MWCKNVSKDIDFYCVLDYNNECKKKRSSDLIQKEMILLVFGYCRISKPTQNIERQERNILASFPNAVIFKEVYTGVVINRHAWLKLSKAVRKGDTIVFDSVSRMSRNAKEGIEQYMELLDKGHRACISQGALCQYRELQASSERRRGACRQ